MSIDSGFEDDRLAAALKEIASLRLLVAELQGRVEILESRLTHSVKGVPNASTD